MANESKLVGLCRRIRGTMGFRLLGRVLAAQGLSSLGTSVSTIALSFMVFELTGSVLQMGGVMAISTFPLVVTSLLGGAILDRYSVRNVMVLADFCRAVLIFVMPWLARESAAYIYVVAALMGVFTAIFNPGQIKLIAELAAREDLVRANSYLSVSQTGAELLGYLLGGGLVAAVGYTITFGIDAASYVVSALLLIGLPRAAVHEGEAQRFATLMAEAPRVLGMIWRRPALRTNLLLATIGLTAVMMSLPNSLGLVYELFDKGVWGQTALEIFTASGMILGGLFISRLSLAGDKNAYVSFGLVAMGVCFLGISFSPLFWLSIALIGLGGVFNVFTFVPSITLFQELPQEEFRGRMIAIRAGFGQMGTTGGLLIGGVLGSVAGVRQAFLIAALMGIGLTGVIYLFHLLAARRRGREAWAAAIDGGACRRDARTLARSAMLGEDVCAELSAHLRPETAGRVGYVRGGSSLSKTVATELNLVSSGLEEEG